MKRWGCLILCALLLAAGRSPARAEEGRRLIRCEYAIYGGMENEDFEMALEEGGEGKADVLRIKDGQKVLGLFRMDRRLEASRWAMEDLQALLERYAPDTWDTLPDAELQALDAPTRLIQAYYSDGEVFVIADSQALPEGSGPLFWEVYRFLDSYAADAPAFTLSFSSFGGGGPEYALSLDAPEKVDWYRQERYDDPQSPQPPGSGNQVDYVFRGRIPGVVHAAVRVSSPLSLPEDADADMEFTLQIGEDYGITLLKDGE